MASEMKSPVEQFAAQLNNTLLEYKKTGRGSMKLGPQGFLGMVKQFLSDPTGTAAIRGVEAQQKAAFLNLRAGKITPEIRRENGMAVAEITAENVEIAVGSLLHLDPRKLHVLFVQSPKMQHQIELKALEIAPDISIGELAKKFNLPLPIPGNVGGVILDAFKGGHLMAGLHDMSTALVGGKPARTEIDILPEENMVQMTLAKNGLSPNYPVSIQYKALKTLQEVLVKRFEKKV